MDPGAASTHMMLEQSCLCSCEQLHLPHGLSSGGCKEDSCCKHKMAGAPESEISTQTSTEWMASLPPVFESLSAELITSCCIASLDFSTLWPLHPNHQPSHQHVAMAVEANENKAVKRNPAADNSCPLLVLLY